MRTSTFTYGITAVIFLIIGSFIPGSLDISIYDTYYVVSNSFWIIFTGLLFALFALANWGLYKLNRKPGTTLFWMHYILTVISILTISVLAFFSTKGSGSYEDYSVMDDLNQQNATNSSVVIWIFISSVILILSQLLYFLNMIRALLMRHKND